MSNQAQTDYFCHPSSFVDEGAKIGKGTKIWHFSHILGGAEIGERCVIGQNVMVGGKVKLGNQVKVQNNVSIYDGVVVEDEVFLGPSCVFTNVFNPRAAIERKNEFRPTILRRGVTLGANCTIVCGITLGQYSFIGAGAVVIRDVPDYALMVGNPSRQTGWMSRTGLRLNFGPDNIATEGNDTYELKDGKVTLQNL